MILYIKDEKGHVIPYVTYVTYNIKTKKKVLTDNFLELFSPVNVTHDCRSKMAQTEICIRYFVNVNLTKKSVKSFMLVTK